MQTTPSPPRRARWKWVSCQPYDVAGRTTGGSDAEGRNDMAEPQRPDRPTRKPGRPGTGNGAFRFRNGLLGWLLFIGLAVMLVILVSKTKTTQTAISVDVFYKMLDQDKVHSITVE